MARTANSRTKPFGGFFITLSELVLFGALVASLTGCAKEEVLEVESDSPLIAIEEPAAESSDESASTTDMKTDEKEEAVNETKADDNSVSLDSVPLIPRDVLFGNPERAQARISPDGKWISFLQPDEGVMNVWVAPIDQIDKAEVITDDRVRGIRSHSWAYNSKHIIYTQDKAGDENWHVYATDVQTKETRDLTPIDGVRGQLAGASERFPDELLIGFNDRDKRYHDIYRVNIETGEKELIQQNDGVAGFVIDDDFKVRMAINFTPTAGQVWLTPKEDSLGEKGYADWEVSEEFDAVDATTSGPAGFDKTGKVLYFEDSRDRDTAAFFSRDLTSGEVKLIAEDSRVDVGGVMSHPTEKTIQAVSFTYSRREWQVLDPKVQPDIDYLTNFSDGFTGGEFIITSRTLDDSKWTVAYLLDDGALRFYRYERPSDGGEGDRKIEYLFSSRSDLDDYQLVKMHTPVIESRDGLKLVSYLSLPPESDPDGDGIPNKPVPMVLDVHGGPWARDGWGFNSMHQWLTNRGYAVLNVNYRGSTGFGKNFLNASNGEWAGKMHDDLIDAVKWAVDQGIAQEDKVAIMGGSYGGYATLVGLTFTPETFACGVDIVGPSNLITLINNVPPYWSRFMPTMKFRVGDWTTEEGKADLLARSPLTKVDEIQRPLLIGQGANDPRVTQLEADQIVEAMVAKKIPVSYALYPDEGHGFARPENRTSFNAVAEAFLAEHLGGRYEPIGDDLEGSSLHVPEGVEGIPGLKEVLPEDRQQMPEAEE